MLGIDAHEHAHESSAKIAYLEIEKFVVIFLMNASQKKHEEAALPNGGHSILNLVVNFTQANHKPL